MSAVKVWKMCSALVSCAIRIRGCFAISFLVFIRFCARDGLTSVLGAERAMVPRLLWVELWAVYNGIKSLGQHGIHCYLYYVVGMDSWGGPSSRYIDDVSNGV